MEKEQLNVSRPNREPKIIENLTFLSADDYSLSEKDFKKAATELNETEEIKNACLRELKDKLLSGKKRYRTDDEYLLRFLRARKFSTEKSYRTIQDFYSVRKKHPEVFDLPSNLENLLNLDFYTRLPYLDEEGRILFKVDYEKWKPAEVTFFEILTLMIIVSDIVTMNPKSQINGVVGIWDMKGISSSHFAQFIYPKRLMLFFKILQVLLLGSDMKELHQYVNPAILPKQLGGKLEDSECSITQHVLDNLPYLKYERSFGADNDNEK